MEKMPEDWRTASVTSAFKKEGKEERQGNSKLVSLTSVLVKVMEPFILDYISKQVEEKFVKSSKHWFTTKEKSCLTNPVAFYDVLISWVNVGRAVNIGYLDLSKASSSDFP